ncbi:MAG: multiheme c-type cytochrome [Fimbriimonas sp.]
MSISSLTRSSISRLALLAGSLAALTYGCHAPSPSKLTLFVSGDSRGYLEPCGCRRDQAGGLPGRARAIHEVAEDGRVVFDVGNMTSGTRDYEMLKMKYLMEGMELIGYDAVNLGENEAELDLEKLRSVLKSSPLPFVSANVVAKEDKKPLTERYRIVQRGGTKIGVIGVTSCDPMDAGPGVEVRPVIETLAEVIPEVKAKSDYLVVLAFSDEETLKEIANKFHEVNCVLGGDVPQPSGAVATVNRASVFNVTDNGKVIGRLDLVSDGGGYRVATSKAIKIAADKQTPPKEIGKLLANFKNELRDRRYEFASVEGMERIEATSGTANEFVGDQACVSCHAQAHTTWKESGHGHALATLKKVNSEFDPECLKCHTVGYGLSSGYIDELKTKQLANVQCESCHGRGKEHAATGKKESLKPVTPATCIKCHDEENSENFNYAKFWPKIKH